MNDIVVLLSKAIPEKLLIEMIAEYSTKSLLTDDAEAKRMLTMCCIMMATREMTEGRDAMEVINGMKELHSLKKSMDNATKQ